MHSNFSIDLRVAPQEPEFVPVSLGYPWVMRALSKILMVLMVVLPTTQAFAEEIPEMPVDPVPVQEVAPEVRVDQLSEPEPEPTLEDPVEDPVSVGEEIATTTEELSTSSDPVLDSELDPTQESQPEPAPEPEPVSEVIDESVVKDEISPVTPYQSFRAETNNEYVFNKADCVLVESGAFYCVDASTAPGDTPKSALASRVFVEKDGDGDTEIYLEDDGVIRKITDNTVDDDAPVFDQGTGRIVWHANVADRYQIFVYDPRAGIVQLTSTPYNNQHPSIDGDRVVFQSWTDENWEVYAVDLSLGFIDAPVTRLSGSGGHDMFPKVYGDFVTWQAREGDAWRSKGMNLVTGEFSDLGAGTQGDVESSRLVLLVERRTASGDVERVGYDLDTGDSIELGSVPVELPPPVEDLPSPYEEPAAIPPAQQGTTTLPTVRDDTPEAGA